MPINFLTRIIMFYNQCNTGLNESTFNAPDAMKNASEPRPASFELESGVGAWGWRIGKGWV
jgi:hypothetical protein